MSVVSVAGALIVSLVLVGVLGAVYQRTQAASPWVPRVLRLTALLLTFTIAFVSFNWVWHDSGWFGLLLIGVPVLCCLVAVVADVTSFRSAMLTTLAAAALLLWSLLTIVGLGLYFLGPAIVLAAAAATTWQQERRRRDTTPTGSAAHRSARRSTTGTETTSTR